MSSFQTGQGGGRAKSRIVIDVDKVRQDAKGGARRGGRARKVIGVGALVALGVVVAAGVGGYLWWRSYQKGPAYSLALLVDAARRDDLQAVDGLVDSDRVADGLAPQVVEKLTGGAVAGLNVGAARPALEAAMPQVMPRIREAVRDEVARGVKAASEKIDKRVPFVLLALGMRRYADVKEEGEAATVALDAEGHTMEVGMQRDGDRWKVVNVKDDAVVSSIAARVAPNILLPKPQEKPTPSKPSRRSARGARPAPTQ